MLLQERAKYQPINQNITWSDLWKAQLSDSLNLRHTSLSREMKIPPWQAALFPDQDHDYISPPWHIGVVHKGKIRAYYWERQVLGKERLIPIIAAEGNTYQLQGLTGRRPCQRPSTRRGSRIEAAKRWWMVVPGSWPMGTEGGAKKKA